MHILPEYMAPFTEEGSVNKHKAAVMNHNCIILGVEYYSSGRAPDKYKALSSNPNTANKN
jgi:hypothetical protein